MRHCDIPGRSRLRLHRSIGFSTRHSDNAADNGGRRADQGFSLIELLIAMTVLAILVAIAVPSYTESVAKGRRADAQSVLMEAAQFMERFYTENLRYNASLAGVAVALPTALAAAPREGSTKYYDIQIQAVGTQTFTLRAVPRTNQSTDRCGTMTLNNLGAKTGSATDCWRR